MTTAPQVTQQISRSGSFELACPARTAFPLFSPEGERAWVDGWNPTPVFPKTIEFRRDTVFRQGDGSEEALWTIVDADWQAYRAEYVRLAPRSHAAHIVVQVEAVEPARCKVTVSYTVTAFGENLAGVLATFSEAAYAEKMRGWQRNLSAHLNAVENNAACRSL